VRGSCKRQATKALAISAESLRGTQLGWKAAPVSRLVIDVSGERAGAFETALASIDIGERIIYHVGEYCAGAHRMAARSAYEDGLVTLCLRRRSKHRFEYIAIKISERG